MNVILLQRIEKLGQMGDVVNVKSGYARNYLLPQRKALRASDANLAEFENRRAQLEAENLSLRQEAEAVARKMEGAAITVIRQAGDAGHLYGSVNNRDIAGGLTEAGYSVDRRQVNIERPIKDIGIHEVRVVLHPEVDVAVSVNVARSEDEAQLQAERAARGQEPIAPGDMADEIAGEQEAGPDASDAYGADIAGEPAFEQSGSEAEAAGQTAEEGDETDGATKTG